MPFTFRDGQPVGQTQDAEKRRFHRITFQGTAFLSCAGDAWRVDVEDLSLHGALVRVDEPGNAPALEQACLLRVLLTADLDIFMESRVARVEGESVGLVVERLDIDSAAHLRRLVELNLGDDTLLNRDLDALFRK
jgi:hypothetical protein